MAPRQSRLLSNSRSVSGWSLAVLPWSQFVGSTLSDI